MEHARDRLREGFTVISGVPERTKATRKAHKELLQRGNQMYESEDLLYAPGIAD